MTNTQSGLPRNLGGYRLVERIGVGGMGTVYRAVDGRTGSQVAVKVIHEHLQSDQTFVDRFRDEAHLASLITSPYVVRVLEFGSDQGQYFLVEEYVDGTKLSDLISSKPMTADEAVAIASQVAMALQAAAAHRVVHRDVKPDNIIIMPDKSVKLTDFGVARLSYVETRQLFLGTVAYAAPEQFRGQATIQSDIYSLGIVLFQMLAGELPFKGDTLSSLIRMHEDVLPPLEKLNNVPDTVRDVVVKCLQKDPANRYADPSELLEALRRLRSKPTPADDATMMVDTMTGPASAATIMQATSISLPQPAPTPASIQAPAAIEAPAAAEVPGVSVLSRSAPPLVQPAIREPDQPSRRRQSVPAGVLIGVGSTAAAAIVVAMFFLLSGHGKSSGSTGSAAAEAPDIAPTVALASISGTKATAVPAAPTAVPAVEPPPPSPATEPPPPPEPTAAPRAPVVAQAPAPAAQAPPPPAVQPPAPVPATSTPATVRINPNRNFAQTFPGVTATLTSLEVYGGTMQLTVRYTNASSSALGLRCPGSTSSTDIYIVTDGGRTIPAQDLYCRYHPSEMFDLKPGDSWSSSATFPNIAPSKSFDLTWYNWGTLSRVTLP